MSPNESLWITEGASVCRSFGGSGLEVLQPWWIPEEDDPSQGGEGSDENHDQMNSETCNYWICIIDVCNYY